MGELVGTSVDDATVVGIQLARDPRGAWRVQARCGFGRPVVIETDPRLPDATPFPTLYWLTCPWLNEYVFGLESACAAAEWSKQLATDRTLRDRLLAADEVYRERRGELAGGADPTPDVGIAGQRDPLATKCLHAHVAARLAGLDDPVGEGVLAGVATECPNDLCGRMLAEEGS